MAQQPDTLTADLFAKPTPVTENSPLDLAVFVEKSYLEYAMSVVMGRALPDVADGQKPVQRRILYAMHELGLYRPARHVKSARVVGDVIGKYHPHGDSAAYEALVRQAQDFSLRYPLIDGQGNFGSRDGDGAAAMRYTECRLTPLAELLLSEIALDTVDFMPNYDGAFQEPRLLPARLPLVLINGASGIGVGMATEIPSHNLTEIARAVVALLDDPGLSDEELLGIVPGPDLPGGGHITSPPSDIAEIYRNGRGSLRMRACWTVEALARGQWRIVVTALPHGVSTRDVLEDIERAINPRIKEGKKTLSPDQAQLKTLFQGALESVRDDSDKNATVRLILEPKSSRQSPDEWMAVLLAHTRLESNLPVNLVMLGRDGRPRQKGLREVLSEWIEFRFLTVVRRSAHQLERAERRIHILEGRQLVLLQIERVIQVIREADEPKTDLMREFSLSDRQADDILEIRLRQLARLEGFRIETELNTLRKEQRGLQQLLGSRKAQATLIRREIDHDRERFGDDRRTRIESILTPVTRALVPDEPVTVTLSLHGWIRVRQGHQLDAAQFGYKSGDQARFVIETRTNQNLAVLDDGGRLYNIRACDIPGGRGDGIPVSALIELPAGLGIADCFEFREEGRYLIASRAGYGFLTRGEDLSCRIRAGKTFLTLEGGETPIAVARYNEGMTHVATLSEKGRLLLFPVTDVKTLPRGKGVILMGLDPGEALVSALLLDPGCGLEIEGISRSGKHGVVRLNTEQLQRHTLSRARKGSPLDHRLKPVFLRAFLS